jgi:hypothetical protein
MSSIESSEVEGDSEGREGTGEIGLGAVACFEGGFSCVFGQGDPWSS